MSGNRDAVRDTLISLDLWTNRISDISLDPALSEACPACQHADYPFLSGDESGGSEEVLCGREAVQISRLTAQPIDLEAIAQKWCSVGRVQSTRFFVRLFLDEQRSLTMFRDGRVVVNGTGEVSEARSLHDRYVGG